MTLLLCSVAQASFGTYLISPKQLAHLPCCFLFSTFQLLPDTQSSWNPWKLLAAFNLEVSGNWKGGKTIQNHTILMNATPSQRPHMSSLSHITTIFWNCFYSQHPELQLLLGNFWIQQAKINANRVFHALIMTFAVSSITLHSHFISLWNKDFLKNLKINVRHVIPSAANAQMRKIMYVKNVGWFKNTQWFKPVISMFHG